LQAGVGSMMASYSSWNGAKVHGHRYLLTELLKNELGFEGFVVSDYLAIDQLDPDYKEAVRRAITAGIDMGMVAHRYREFIQRSRGELGFAKAMYVETRSGWFSDRTQCYLASGRPAVVRDTGFGDVLPTGEGLLAFTSAAEAEQAMAAVEDDYDRHRRRAREIAAEYFDAEKVLRSLLERAGVV
ncbi:MAG: hypothetical protein K6T92_01020, partial [Candidatus Rokubacteria bacterium]|nr:hypothetical protein [Candidatus Rokubacteria bacterium]